MSESGALRLGLVGKLPAHGDFVRRGDLPAVFCAALDAWLQEGIAAARAAIGEDRWSALWDAAPAWRFALPGGACGPDPVAGVLVPSRDSVGRRWPLALVAVVEGSAEVAWPAAWFAHLEGVARAALAEGHDADGVAAKLPAPDATVLPEGGDPGSGGDPLAAFWASVDGAAEPGLPAAEGAAEETAPTQEDPSPNAADPAMMQGDAAVERVRPGWWTAASADGTPGLVWPLPALPPVEEFVLLLESEA